MHCYFQLVNEQETVLDGTGVDVPDHKTAKAEAHKAISELRQEYDAPSRTGPAGGWRSLAPTELFLIPILSPRFCIESGSGISRRSRWRSSGICPVFEQSSAP
ncbi:DUF6894 family protein (plasmid) [Microvirga sp. RSM25]|uniref:DUF6894 family protein n=1 Tax=Microvirga sp. RSM25 TaxID=3273802 RepID=UPI00384E9BE5